MAAPYWTPYICRRRINSPKYCVIPSSVAMIAGGAPLFRCVFGVCKSEIAFTNKWDSMVPKLPATFKMAQVIIWGPGKIWIGPNGSKHRGSCDRKFALKGQSIEHALDKGAGGTKPPYVLLVDVCCSCPVQYQLPCPCYVPMDRSKQDFLMIPLS